VGSIRHPHDDAGECLVFDGRNTWCKITRSENVRIAGQRQALEHREARIRNPSVQRGQIICAGTRRSRVAQKSSALTRKQACSDVVPEVPSRGPDRRAPARAKPRRQGRTRSSPRSDGAAPRQLRPIGALVAASTIQRIERGKPTTSEPPGPPSTAMVGRPSHEHQCCTIGRTASDWVSARRPATRARAPTSPAPARNYRSVRSSSAAASAVAADPSRVYTWSRDHEPGSPHRLDGQTRSWPQLPMNATSALTSAGLDSCRRPACCRRPAGLAMS